MCLFQGFQAVVMQHQANAERLQTERMAELNRRQFEHERWASSRTPHQDELAAQLERCRNAEMKIVRRRFYCAGYSWEAEILVRT